MWATYIAHFFSCLLFKQSQKKKTNNIPHTRLLINLSDILPLTQPYKPNCLNSHNLGNSKYPREFSEKNKQTNKTKKQKQPPRLSLTTTFQKYPSYFLPPGKPGPKSSCLQCNYYFPKCQAYSNEFYFFDFHMQKSSPMTIFGNIWQWSNEMGKNLLYKIAFRSCIMQFYITSGFHYSIFGDF